MVAGAGAIGCLVGGRLAAIGCPVTLLGRRRWVDTIKTDGLHLRWPDGRQQTVRPQAVEDLTELDTLSQIDLVLVTVKSFATASIVKELKGRLAPRTRVLSLQNGVGNEAILASGLSEQPVLAGSITLPVIVPDVGTIVVSKDKGGIGLAPFSTGAVIDDVAALFRRAEFTVTTYPDHRCLKWSKLLLNIIGNASSAILDMPPGQSLAHREIFDLEIEALRETLAVMKAQQIRVIAFPDYPLPLLAFALRWLPNPILRPILRSAMVGGRGDKLPSLQLDLRQGRTESEITVLNGVVATQGKQLRIPVPVNQGLHDILSGIVSGRIPWDDYKGKPEVLSAQLQQRR